MKKSKRLSALAMTALMTTSLFAGAAANAADNDNLNEPGTFPICKEKESFSIMVPQGGTSDVAESFNNLDYEEKTNVHIDWISVPQDSWKEKVSVTLAGGDYPDVIAGMNTYNIEASDEALYAAQGILIPLNDLIDQYAPNFKALMDADPTIKKLIAQDDGNIYSMPLIAQCYHCNYSQKMYINSQWLENLGLEMPTTLDEYYNVLKAFKEQDANGNGDPDDEIPLITSKAGWHVDLDGYLMNAFTYCDAETYLAVEDGDLVYTATKDEYREGLRFLKKLYDEGLLSPESFTNDDQTNAKINVSGGDYTMFGSFPAAYQMYVGDTELWREYDIMAPLVKEDGTATTPNYSLTRDVVRGNFAITSAAEHPELIIQWLDYFYCEEGAMYRKGREGIEWEAAQEGDTDYVGNQARYRNLQTPEDDPFYNNVDFSQNIPYLDSKEHREAAAVAKDFREDAVNWQEIQLFQATVNYEAVAPSNEMSIPLLSVSEDKAMDYSRMKTEISDYQKEALVQFITGAMDLDKDWDGYIKQLNAIGLEEYMSMSNEAYHAFLNR